MKLIRKTNDIFSIILVSLLLLNFLIYLVVLANIDILSFLSALALTYMAMFFQVAFEYGAPLWIILFAVYGYFNNKKKLGLSEKKFDKRVIPHMLPAFIINCCLLVSLVFEVHYVYYGIGEGFF